MLFGDKPRTTSGGANRLNQSMNRATASPRTMPSNGKPGIPGCGTVLVDSEEPDEGIGEVVVTVVTNSNTVVVT